RPPHRDFSVPFGFVQSPAVASLVLAKSQLGLVIRKLEQRGTPVSVYVDDITVSGASEGAVASVIDALRAAAAMCSFDFNAEKETPPAATATSFNIEFGSGVMRIIADRMAEFELAVRTAFPE